MANDILTKLKEKIRALIEDKLKNGIETFEYISSSIFTLAEPSIQAITAVLKNGTALTSGQYSFSTTTNKITISASMTSGDIIEVDYTYYSYSNSELISYIKSALVWISVHSYSDMDFEFENNETDDDPGFIFPTPDNRTNDLIALISAVLIKPDYTSYRLPNVTVNYANRISKEDKIERLINKFNSTIGYLGILKIE